MTEKYRPSNEAEGEIFTRNFCDNCLKAHPYEGCEILARSIAFSIDDPKYPQEWIKDERGLRCTAFDPIKKTPEQP